jgi:hypothetical protein
VSTTERYEQPREREDPEHKDAGQEQVEQAREAQEQREREAQEGEQEAPAK